MNGLRAWLAQHPPPDSNYRQSLAGVARRICQGDDFWISVRELQDELALTQTDAQRARAIAEGPPLTGEPRFDAYLAALAEHVAVHHQLSCPPWACEPDRFLDRFWFVSEVKSFRAQALAQAPAAFRRRGIFVPARSLHRV
ncbi:MAG: hypothetical protein M3Z27_01815 [Actinomycetota bacterium]|nr:hypothetical protein [Actinomycetota bacterium]